MDCIDFGISTERTTTAATATTISQLRAFHNHPMNFFRNMLCALNYTIVCIARSRRFLRIFLYRFWAGFIRFSFIMRLIEMYFACTFLLLFIQFTMRFIYTYVPQSMLLSLNIICLYKHTKYAGKSIFFFCCKRKQNYVDFIKNHCRNIDSCFHFQTMQ